MKISPVVLDTLNKVPAVHIPLTDLSTAPLDLVLAGIGLRMQQLATTNADFQKLLEGRKATIRIATEDGIGRSFSLDEGKVSHAAEGKTADFTIQFKTAEQALSTLLKGDATAFMTGMQEGSISMTGDYSLLMWFNQAAKLLVPRVPESVKSRVEQVCDLAASKKSWLMQKKAQLLG